jgi:hypothetical protein
MLYQNENPAVGAAGFEEMSFPGGTDTLESSKSSPKAQAKIARAPYWAFPNRRCLIAAATAKEWPVQRLQQLAAEAIARGMPIQKIPCVYRSPSAPRMRADHRPRLALGSFGCSQIWGTA